MKYLLLYVLLVSLIAGCAAVKPPPGGPDDKTPPIIEKTFPEQKVLNVRRDARFHFWFKHNIDRTSFMNAINITPYMGGLVKYNWYGYDEVEVQLPDTLRANTTYIITLSKDLRTYRNAPSTAPYQLIFSTGSVIDTAVIAGNILPPVSSGAPPDIKNISVFGYDISVVSPDTLELDKVRPDYITQPSDKGEFEFKAMKEGHKYRLLAVVDEFRNHIYDPGVDAYGMPQADVNLDSLHQGGVRIRMMPRVDTSKPQLQDWEVPDAFHLKVRFSKSVDSASVLAEHFFLRDSISKEEIHIVSAYRENIDKHAANLTLLLASPLKKERTYELNANDSIKDLAGNHIDTSKRTLWLRPADFRDTFPPPKFYGFPLTDSMRGVVPEFDNVVSFSDAVDTLSFQNGITFVDSAGHTLPIHFRWIDGIRCQIKPTTVLLPRAFYKLTFATKSVRSAAPVHFGSVKDTMTILRFFTGEKTEYGTVSGTVEIGDSLLHVGHLSVKLFSPETNWSATIQLPAGVRDYKFEMIPRGKYKVQAWLTNRADGSYEGGAPIPLKFALPSGDYPDEFEVRPRWTTEHVDITLR